MPNYHSEYEETRRLLVLAVASAKANENNLVKSQFVRHRVVGNHGSRRAEQNRNQNCHRVSHYNVPSMILAIIS